MIYNNACAIVVSINNNDDDAVAMQLSNRS